MNGITVRMGVTIHVCNNAHFGICCSARLATVTAAISNLRFTHLDE